MTESRRRGPTLIMERWAVPVKNTPQVTETWDDHPPQEVCDMLQQFCSPKTKSPARLSVGNDLGYKDFGTGWGANVMLSFDVDPDLDTIEAARADVGALVRELLGQQFVEAEDLYNELVAPRLKK